MKRIITLFVTAIMLMAVVALPLTACNKGREEVERTEYEIIASYDEQSKTITASMEVEYVNASDAALNEVCFHLYPAAFREGARFSPVPEGQISTAYPDGMSYGGITVDTLSVDGATVTPVIEGEDEDILAVALNGELLPGEETEIIMTFTLTLPAVRHRFGYQGRRVNLGNWYPIACVYENGNFVTDPYYNVGDPFYSDCADYTVSLTVPSDLTVASTGEQTVTSNDTTKTITATAENVRDFAAVLGEFKMLGSQINGVNVNYYYSSDATPELALTAATDSIKTFSELFGAYPYKTYSAVETQFIQGGMEYPMLTMISDAVTGNLYQEVIIHETAHQWWYAAVGNDEVRHAWLDEGLTEYSTSIFYQKNPDYNVDYTKRMADALGAYVLYYDTFKNGSEDTSMNRPVNEYKSGFEYNYMTYVKGELMLESLRSVIGDDAFFGGLRAYYSEYCFKNATPDCLIACFEQSSGKPLKSFFAGWIEGKVSHYGGLKG